VSGTSADDCSTKLFPPATIEPAINRKAIFVVEFGITNSSSSEYVFDISTFPDGSN
jgi:hypothetical protein